MNVHDSEKVVGSWYRKAIGSGDGRAGRPGLYNTCSIRDKAEQKVFNRSPITRNTKSKARRLACWAASPSRRAKRFRARALRFRWSADRPRTQPANMLIQIEAGKQRVTGLDDRETDECFEPSSPPAPTRSWIHHHHRRLRQVRAYCVVPYTRGKERSRTSDSVLAEARQMADLGYTEIQLLGQNVNFIQRSGREAGRQENICGAVGRGRRNSRHPSRPLHYIAPPHFGRDIVEAIDAGAYALRPCSSPRAERFDACARRHAAPLHSRAVLERIAG